MKRSTMLMMLGAAAIGQSFSHNAYLGRATSFRPRGNTMTDGRYFRHVNRLMSEFTIKGHKIMAYSKKDAITRLKHQKLI